MANIPACHAGVWGSSPPVSANITAITVKYGKMLEKVSLMALFKFILLL
jgi:hypothetical protein